MAKRYGGDPYWLRNRYGFVCSCGAPIEPGNRAFYYPNGKKMLCEKCGDKADAQFAAAKQDEAFMSGGGW